MQTAPGWCFKNNSEKRTLLLCAGHECTVSPTRVAKATHGAAFERVPAEPRAGSRELRDAGASPARELSPAPLRSSRHSPPGPAHAPPRGRWRFVFKPRPAPQPPPPRLHSPAYPAAPPPPAHARPAERARRPGVFAALRQAPPAPGRCCGSVRAPC